MEPSEKSPEIDQFIKEATGIDRKESIKSDVCAICKNPVGEFRDGLSLKEYHISGMCQNCQDSVFGGEE